MKVLHHGVSRLKELKCKKQKITGLSAYLNHIKHKISNTTFYTQLKIFQKIAKNT